MQRGPGGNRRTRLSKRRSWLDWLKLGAIVSIAAAYSYALFLRPLAAAEVLHWPVFGSSLTRLASVALRPAQAADQCGVPSGVMWPVRSAGVGLAGGAVAATTGIASTPTEGALYGAVAETALPWYVTPPERLQELRDQIGARRLVTAFRTTLPNPIWEETANVARGAEYLAGTVLQPGETMSLFAAIGPFTEARGYGDGPSYANNRVVPSTGGGVCKIATALYNAAVHADLQVLERKPHSMQVPYVPAGRDAAIATGSKDVRIRNDQDTPVLLWAGMRDTTLFVAVYGQYDPPVVEWFHEQSKRRTARPVRRKNPDLPPGEEHVVSEGYDGVTVRTWIVIQRPGQPEERRDMGVDTYRPLPGVIEYGP